MVIVGDKHKGLVEMFIKDVDRIIYLEESVVQELYTYISTSAKSRIIRADLYIECTQGLYKISKY